MKTGKNSINKRDIEHFRLESLLVFIIVIRRFVRHFQHLIVPWDIIN